jgi:L-lactate dehydrogenase complex protein LldG
MEEREKGGVLMNHARDEILNRLRQSLHRQGPPEPAALLLLEQRMAKPKTHVQPRLNEDLTQRFINKLKAVHVTVEQVATLKAVAGAVTEYLHAQSLPQHLLMSKDVAKEDIEWPQELHIEHRPAQDKDRVTLTGVFAAVAETGSVVLLSGPNSPTTLNFLPVDHIVLVREEQILPYVEDVWTRLRKDGMGLPRTVNFITGPSKTADVEQTIHYGAHGPQRLHIILVRRTGSSS